MLGRMPVQTYQVWIVSYESLSSSTQSVSCRLRRRSDRGNPAEAYSPSGNPVTDQILHCLRSRSHLIRLQKDSPA